MTNLKKNQNEKTQEVLVDILKDAKVMMLKYSIKRRKDCNKTDAGSRNII